MKRAKTRGRNAVTPEQKMLQEQKAFIKREVDNMELEAKYIHYNMELPKLKAEFQAWLDKNKKLADDKTTEAIPKDPILEVPVENGMKLDEIKSE